MSSVQFGMMTVDSQSRKAVHGSGDGMPRIVADGRGLITRRRSLGCPFRDCPSCGSRRDRGFQGWASSCRPRGLVVGAGPRFVPRGGLPAPMALRTPAARACRRRTGSRRCSPAAARAAGRRPARTSRDEPLEPAYESADVSSGRAAPIVGDDDRAARSAYGRSRTMPTMGCPRRPYPSAGAPDARRRPAVVEAPVRAAVEHDHDVEVGWPPRMQARQQPVEPGPVAAAAYAMQHVVAVDEDERQDSVAVRGHPLRAVHRTPATIRGCSSLSTSTVSSIADRAVPGVPELLARAPRPATSSSTSPTTRAGIAASMRRACDRWARRSRGPVLTAARATALALPSPRAADDVFSVVRASAASSGTSAWHRRRDPTRPGRPTRCGRRGHRLRALVPAPLPPPTLSGAGPYSWPPTGIRLSDCRGAPGGRRSIVAALAGPPARARPRHRQARARALPGGRALAACPSRRRS